MAERGWALVVDARRADRLADAVDGLSATARIAATDEDHANPPAPAPIVGIAGDITDPGHRAALLRAAAGVGPIDLVVNNASTLGRSPLPAMDSIGAEGLRRTFDVNVVAPIALVSEALPALAAGAAIVNITSDAAVEAYRVGVATAPARPRSSTPAVCSPSNIPASASSSLTRATCAPRCTRTRFPARTFHNQLDHCEV